MGLRGGQGKARMKEEWPEMAVEEFLSVYSCSNSVLWSFSNFCVACCMASL